MMGIENDELEKFRQNFSRCTNRDVAPLTIETFIFSFTQILITCFNIYACDKLYFIFVPWQTKARVRYITLELTVVFQSRIQTDGTGLLHANTVYTRIKSAML